MAAIDQSEGPGEADATYRSQAEAEIERYRNCVNVHDLPPIYAYWNNGHVIRLIEQARAADVYDIWDAPFRELCGRLEHVRAISLGSGNGDFELGIATRLRAEGIDNFTIERLEFNPHMRERAARDAAAGGDAADGPDLARNAGPIPVQPPEPHALPGVPEHRLLQ